jgi:hypothetical protein
MAAPIISWDPCARKGLFGECIGGMKSTPQPVVAQTVERQSIRAPVPIATAVLPVPVDIVPTVSDYSMRKTNLNTLLSTIEAMALKYQMLSSKSGAAASDKTDLNAQIQALRNQSNDLDHATETYEKEFIERKETLNIKNTGFQTLQDIVLAMFFIGFTAFSILLILSAGGFVKSFITAIVLFVLAVLIMQIIRFYG